MMQGMGGEGLEERARLQRLLVEAELLAEIGSFRLDLETRQAVWSRGLYRIWGLEPGTAPPDLDVMADGVHPEDRERVRADLRRIVERPDEVTPEALTDEHRIVRPDGSVRTVRIRGRLERDTRGRPVAYYGAVQDVTDRRLTERELQAHYALSQALRDWESFQEGVTDLLRRLGTALDYEMGCIWLFDERRGRISPRAFWRAPGVDTRRFEEVSRDASFAPGEGVVGSVWLSGEPFFTNDTGLLQSARRAAALELGLQSALVFPAICDDGVIAVLSFYTLDLRAPSERLIRTLTGIGRELGRFLASRRAELGSRRLTERELDVLRLAAEGHTGPRIAELLFVSPATVKTHFQHIYEKLGVADRAGAVAHALRTGLIR